MNLFQVIANGVIFGTYEADTEKQACELCAQDAGYASVADMEARLGLPSELEGRLVCLDDVHDAVRPGTPFPWCSA